MSEENKAALEAALKKLIHAVKTYRFTPDDCPEKAMSAADLDDAIDEAKIVLATDNRKGDVR